MPETWMAWTFAVTLRKSFELGSIASETTADIDWITQVESTRVSSGMLLTSNQLTYRFLRFCPVAILSGEREYFYCPPSDLFVRWLKGVQSFRASGLTQRFGVTCTYYRRSQQSARF